MKFIRPSFRVAWHRLAFAAARAAIACFSNARRNESIRRSLWTGAPILTVPIKAKAERLLGIKAETLSLERYSLRHDFNFDFSRWMRWAPVRAVLPYVLLIWACRRFQRFHFFYDRGILPSLVAREFNIDELRLLRELGKEVYFYAYGADVRTQTASRALGADNACSECPAVGRLCKCDDASWNKTYREIRSLATGVFSMGDMLEYTPGSRNDLFYWPVDLSEDDGRRFAPRYPLTSSREPIRIVHAPNHRHFKGTRHLLDAVDTLRREGLSIELVLIEKISNDEALAQYRTADVIFDQCLIGFHGYTALEAMALGKPVVCFIRKPAEYLLAPDECPIVNATTADLVTVLRRLVQDRRRLRALGKAGRLYVQRYYTVAAFAERLHRATTLTAVSPLVSPKLTQVSAA